MVLLQQLPFNLECVPVVRPLSEGILLRTVRDLPCCVARDAFCQAKTYFEYWVFLFPFWIMLMQGHLCFTSLQESEMKELEEASIETKEDEAVEVEVEA